MRAARAKCSKVLVADLSVITKVNVLQIRAARAQCTTALVADHLHLEVRVDATPWQLSNKLLTCQP